jgi:predicted glycoside hydrolase/deacetylase ChbG (UPF0249 family)
VRKLIVNADDFGLTPGVNRAVAELYDAGALTSTTLMARAMATDQAIELALARPALGVGCHVVLVDGDPVLDPLKQIPHLANAASITLRAKPGSLLAAIYASGPRTRRAIQQEIEAETAAQIALLQGRGLQLTHIDTHKHLHIFPDLLRPVLRAARAAGISKVRNPFEPSWSLGATSGAPMLRRIKLHLTRSFQPSFHRILAEEGFVTTGGAIGVLATGTLSSATLHSLLKAVPPGTWELVTHPGYNDADLAQARTRLLASRETERNALPMLKNMPEIELVSFAALPAASSHTPQTSNGGTSMLKRIGRD